MSNSVTYTFTSTSGIGSNSRFYIPAQTNTFEKLDIMGVSIDNISVPLQYYTVNKKNNTIFAFGGTDVNIDIDEKTTIDEFTTLLDEAIKVINAECSATMSSVTLANGTTAYRLTVDTTGSVQGYDIFVDHSKHYLALILGLDEGYKSGDAVVFDIPFDNFNGVIFTDTSVLKIYCSAIPFDVYEEEFTFQLAEGRYTETELATHLDGLINAEAFFAASGVTFDPKTGKLVFDLSFASSLTHIIIRKNRLLGFNNDTTYPPNYGLMDTIVDISIQAPNPPNLQPTTQIHIKSNQLSLYQRNKKQIWPGIKSIITTIPISKAIGEVEVVDLSNQIIKYSNPIRLNYIDFTLIADDGSVIDIRNALWTITLTFYYSNPISIT
jgi:hypothetical protein